MNVETFVKKNPITRTVMQQIVPLQPIQPVDANNDANLFLC